MDLKGKVYQVLLTIQIHAAILSMFYKCFQKLLQWMSGIVQNNGVSGHNFHFLYFVNVQVSC